MNVRWFNVKCNNKNECINILLVADPQIIGKRNEKLHFLTPLSIFDSDRYLKNTFKYAFDFSKPDIIIFLGDIMDEGSIASSEEFNTYLQRISNIFQINELNKIQCIWLPGDNDVGGEGIDRITHKKIKRFFQSFQQPDIFQIKNLTFVKIIRLIYKYPNLKNNKSKFDIIIGLSHLPLLFNPSLFVEKVLNKLQPQILFSGHEHKSMILYSDGLLRSDRQIIPVTLDDNKIYEFSLDNNIYEFIVPTCSYRMGTDKIGFGFAIIENNNIRYTVLWSPPRFLHLKYYVYFFSFIFFIILLKFFKCNKIFCR